MPPSTPPSPTRSRRRRSSSSRTGPDSFVAALEGPNGNPGTGPQQGYVFGGGNTVPYIFDDKGAPVQVGDRPAPVPDGLPIQGGIDAANTAPDSTDVRTASLQLSTQPPVTVPLRVMTVKVTAQQDGNTYYIQVLQDRSTEVETLQALLTVLLVGGVIVVAVAVVFGWLYAQRALVPIRDSFGAQRDGPSPPAGVRR